MKKGLSLLLVALMALGLSTAAMAEPYYLEAAGVTIDVPEGMLAQDASDEASYALLIMPEGRTDILYMYALYYQELLEEIDLSELTEEELADVVEGFFGTIEEPEYEMMTIGELEYLVLANGAGTEVHFIRLVDGWMTDVLAKNMEDLELSEEDIELCITLVESIVYDEDAEGATP